MTRSTFEDINRAFKALEILEEIRKIIESPLYIQEDVIKYQMICEVIKREREDH